MFFANIIIPAIGMTSLFLLAVMIPFLGFLLPVYKIKKLSRLTTKEKIASNLITIGVIGAFDIHLLPFYIGIFLVIETLYYFFKNTNREVEHFDRIMLSSLLVSVISIITFKLIVGDIDILAANKEVYTKLFELDPKDLEDALNIMRDNSLLLAFIYSFICNYLTYFILDGRSYRHWKVSYKWIVPYIAIFFIKKFTEIDNFYLNNIYNITKTLYIAFGIKVVYSIIRNLIPRYRGLVKFTAIVTAMLFPMVTFIIGAIDSFNTIKVVVMKSKK